MSAALQLFEKKGYLDTSMEEIAETADVARGTLYNHFESKADVLLALTSSVGEGWLECARAKYQKTDSPSAAIKEVLTAAAEWFDEHPSSATAFYHAMRELMAKHSHASPPPLLVPREWVIEARQKEEFTTELPVDLEVLMLDCVLRHHMIELLCGTAKGKLAPSVKRQTEIVMRRLRP